MICGLPALPMPAMRPSLMPMSAFTIPWTASITSAFVMTKSSAPSAAVTPPCVPRPSRSVLPPPNTHSSPGHEIVPLDLGPELGVAEADAVADRRPEELDVLLSRQSAWASSRSPEPAGARPVERLIEPRSPLVALGQRVEPVDPSLAAEVDELDLALVPGLEADCGARRDVETHPERLRAIELELVVHLEEVVVRARPESVGRRGSVP